MAVLVPTEEDDNDEDEFLDDNDPPIHVNPVNEPPRERALADLGVCLRPRLWVNISDDVSCLQPHLECGAQATAPQAQQMPITETQLGTSLQHCCKAIGSSESRGEDHLVKRQCLAPESKARLMQKKKADASNGNDAEQLQQESTRKVSSTQAALSFEKEAGTRPRWTDKELHTERPISDPVDGNEPRVNRPAVERETSAENYSYSIETNSDQALTASGYDNRQQPRARRASINSQQLNRLDPNRRSQPPTSQPARNTSVAPQTNPLPPQNGSTGPQFQHPNIKPQINAMRHIPHSFAAVTPQSQPVNHTATPCLRLQDSGIFYERPKQPEYAILTKRLETFQGWPAHCPVSKENVAKSGFYHEGDGDIGRCFFCGGSLKNWQPGDDPFVEHAFWFPKCGYIRQYKGQAFVEIVQFIKKNHPERKTITLAQVVEEMDKLGVTESNAFEEEPVEHDAAVKSLLDGIQSQNSALTYTRDEVIQAAQILRNQSIALSSDLILSELRQKHDATDRASGATAGARATSGASNTGTIAELKDQNSTLRNKLVCKICMDKAVKIVFLPCGHLVTCQECAMAFYDCPICGSHIRAYVRANIG